MMDLTLEKKSFTVEFYFRMITKVLITEICRRYQREFPEHAVEYKLLQVSVGRCETRNVGQNGVSRRQSIHYSRNCSKS
jgi:hypothetical protein